MVNGIEELFYSVYNKKLLELKIFNISNK